MTNPESKAGRGLMPHSHTQRMARRDEKRRRLLAFLSSEIWTTPTVAGQIIGLQDSRSINSTLSSMERDQLVARQSIYLPSGRLVTVAGITPEGQARAAYLLDRPVEPRSFERGRIGLTQIEHRIDLQMLRVRLAQSGWKGWRYPDRQSPKQKNAGHRPDAIVRHPSGVVVAIEVERTIKTLKRYRAISGQHLSAIERGDYTHVIYSSPCPEKSNAVRDMMHKIERVFIAGRAVTITPEQRVSRILCKRGFLLLRHPILELDGKPV